MKTNLTMDRIKERQKLSWQGVFYGIQRIDLLIISISGAGIYICFETLKYLHESSMDISNSIKISGGFLLIAIMINFLSQIFGRKSNYYDYLWCEVKLDAKDEPTDEQKTLIKDYDNKPDCYSSITNWLTYISIGFMSIGLICLTYYFFTTF